MGSREQLVHLLEAPDGMAEIVPTDVPRLLGELETLRIRLMGRLLGSQPGPYVDRDAREAADRLLTLQEASEALGVRSAWLRRHWRGLPFSRKLGRRTLRFSAAGLGRWLGEQPRRA